VCVCVCVCVCAKERVIITYTITGMQARTVQRYPIQCSTLWWYFAPWHRRARSSEAVTRRRIDGAVASFSWRPAAVDGRWLPPPSWPHVTNPVNVGNQVTRDLSPDTTQTLRRYDDFNKIHLSTCAIAPVQTSTTDLRSCPSSQQLTCIHRWTTDTGVTSSRW